MNFIEEMIGVTIELNQEEMKEKIVKFLLEEEILLKGYQIIRDILILTDKRIIMVDYIGVRGRKVQYHMIPYQSINRFVIDSPGTLDTDYTLKLYIKGSLEPLEKQLKKNIDIYELNHIIFSHII